MNILKRKKRGAELVEIIIGLAIIGTLALGVFSAINTNVKTNTTSSTTKVTDNMDDATTLTY